MTTTSLATGHLDEPPRAELSRADRDLARFGGLLLALGTIGMGIGAAVMTASGADVFAAMESSARTDIAKHLSDVADKQTILVVHFSIWIVSFIMLALGGSLLVRMSSARPLPAAIARFGFDITAAAAIIYYSAMMGIVVGLAPAHAAGQDVLAVTRAIGFGAATADWVATIIVLGICSVALSESARTTWTPPWLRRLAYVALTAGGISAAALILDERPLASIILPFGMAHMIAAGILAVRYSNNAGEKRPAAQATGRP